MKVTIGTPEKIIGEQTVEPEVGYIAEMVTDAGKLDDFVPNMSAKGRKLVEANKDEEPQFPVVRVEEGWSNSRRLWTAKQLESIAEQCNALEPVAHLGHIKEEDAPFVFPDPQTLWLGAITKREPSKLKERMGEMVTVAYFAGYNLPNAKVRGFIKNRVVRGVSWWGPGEAVPIPGRGVEVKNFKLRALDWARKLSEGMPSSAIVATVSEQTGGITVGEKSLAQVTPEEFKKENPNGYALLVSEAVKEKDEQIGEMEKKVEAGDKAQSLLTKVCEAVGIEKADDLLSKIEEIQSRIGDKAKASVSDALDKLLLQKIPGDSDEAKQKRATVKRLVPIGEMESKAEDAKDGEAVTTLVSEMTDKAFNEDDIIKQYVGEQAPVHTRRRDEFDHGKGDDPLKDNKYVAGRERVTVG